MLNPKYKSGQRRYNKMISLDESYYVSDRNSKNSERSRSIDRNRSFDRSRSRGMKGGSTAAFTGAKAERSVEMPGGNNSIMFNDNNDTLKQSMIVNQLHFLSGTNIGMNQVGSIEMINSPQNILSDNTRDIQQRKDPNLPKSLPHSRSQGQIKLTN